MSAEWPEISIDDIKAPRPGSIAIGPFGSRMKSDCYVSDGVRVVRGTNLTGGRSFSGVFVFITSEKAEELNSANLLPNDLVFPHRGAIGEVGIVPNDGQRYVLSSSLMKLTCDADRAHPDFLFYFFRSEAGRFELLKNASQVGTPGIGQPLTSLKQIKLKLPPVDEQRAIAGVLRALDHRIALLRETNATLEAIAQALFKSWFVDFDPVRAKSQGLAPAGMDEATAGLFPDGFEESALGLVPKGWSVRSVEEIAERVGMGPFGSNIKVSTFVERGTPVLNGANVQGALLEDREFRFVTEEHAARLRNSCVRSGDIVLTHRGTLGQVSLVPGESKFAEYVVSQSQFFLRCDSSVMQPEWMLYFLRSPAGQHLLLANASQVGVPSIARPSSYLRSIRLVVPCFEVVERFAEVVRSIHAEIISNRGTSGTLATLRDTLLPRLISGQLRLPEAEALAT